MSNPSGDSPAIHAPKRSAPVRLRVRDRKGFEKTVLIKRSLFRIGRDPQSDLHLDHPSIAPCHVVILRDGDAHRCTYTSEGAGIFVNGTPISTGELRDGDRISFGDVCPYEAFFLIEESRAGDDQERRLGALLNATKAINSSLVLDQILAKVMDSVMELTKASKGFLMIVDADSGLRAQVARNIERAALDQEVIPASRSVIDQVVQTRKPVFLCVDGSQGRGAPSKSIARLNLKAIMCVPIISPERLIGIIYVDHEESFLDVTKMNLEILEALADHASIAIENARMAEKMLLAERVTAVGRMVSSIVHDLRGPLAGIRAAAELIRDDPQSPKGPRLTSMILGEVDRMAGMAQEVLDYCRGKVEMRMALVDLSAFLSGALEPSRESLESRSISLNLGLDAAIALPLDAGRMDRVIRNLVANALDAMPDGGVLSVTTGIKDGQAIVRFTDTGRGMTEEIRRRIFEPFFTHGKRNGNGLGMSIALRIVEAHGGAIQLESAPGTGTCVALTLPLGPASQRLPDSEPAPTLVAVS